MSEEYIIEIKLKIDKMKKFFDPYNEISTNEEVKRELISQFEKHIFEFIEEALKERKVCKVTPCWASTYNGIKCLEDEDNFMFFKSKQDLRPSSTIRVRKDEIERLQKVLAKGEKE